MNQISNQNMRRYEVYNRLMKSFLQNNDIEMYSAQSEGNSAVAEILIKTLKKL